MIDANFFRRNRQALIEQLESDSVVWLTAYTSLQLSGDAAAPFQQEANFWYLTGIAEPDWQVIITQEKTWLVAPDISEIHRVFDGSLSDAAACMQSGVDEVLSVKAARVLLTQLASNHTTVHTLGKDPHARYYSFGLNPAPGRLALQLKRTFQKVHDVRTLLAPLRAIKQSEEVTTIEKAITVTVDAFRHAKETIPGVRHEYELEAEFTAHFRRNNAHHAYDPIVASGVNACTLHYGKNDTAWQAPSLVLLDVGARTHGYAADITRTYAVGEATVRQRSVHAAVRQAHQEIIGLLRPGLSLMAYQEESDAIMKNTLKSLDLLTEDSDYRRYFPHAISHGLGVDVHDSLGGFGEFRPGMVLTVEPGIYIPEEEIGVRLEDDILITEKGNRNLSESLSLDL